MARLLALIFVALFATSNAGLVTTSQQQVVTNQGSPVHATQGWNYEDCGQSSLYDNDVTRYSSFPFFKAFPLIPSKLTRSPCSLTLRNPDKT